MKNDPLPMFLIGICMVVVIVLFTHVVFLTERVAKLERANNALTYEDIMSKMTDVVICIDMATTLPDLPDEENTQVDNINSNNRPPKRLRDALDVAIYTDCINQVFQFTTWVNRR